jgi:hypothetical protein
MFGTLIGVLFMISSCDVLDAPYYGCTNPLADNYNVNATHDDGTCVYDPSLFRGCIDTAATNYDATALVNDCHCQLRQCAEGVGGGLHWSYLRQLPTSR